MVCISIYNKGNFVLIPLLSPFLTFFLFSVLLETPVFLSMIARAFLSDTALKRMTIRAREELKAFINVSIANASDDDNVRDLSHALARVQSDLLTPYADKSSISIKHSPYEGDGNSIRAVVHQQLTIRNPREELSPFRQPFKTSLRVGRTKDDKPTYELVCFRVLHDGSKVVELNADDVEISRDPSGEFIYTIPEVEYQIPGNSTITVIYHSIRIIPFHDIYQYFVRLRPSLDLNVSYDYADLKAAYPDLKPNIWLYSRTSKIDELSNEGGEIVWCINKWLVRGDGFAISW